MLDEDAPSKVELELDAELLKPVEVAPSVELFVPAVDPILVVPVVIEVVESVVATSPVVEPELE